MNGDRSDTDDSGRNGTGGSASGGTSGGDASGTGTLDAVDRPEPTYTRAVAEATLRRIVEPARRRAWSDHRSKRESRQ